MKQKCNERFPRIDFNHTAAQANSFFSFTTAEERDSQITQCLVALNALYSLITSFTTVKRIDTFEHEYTTLTKLFDRLKSELNTVLSDQPANIIQAHVQQPLSKSMQMCRC